MNTLLNITEKYIEYCETQKCLNSKTLKAYCTDLNQFIDFLNNPYIHAISISDIENYIGYLHRSFKPKTAKRKLATVKSFYTFLEYKDLNCPTFILPNLIISKIPLRSIYFLPVRILPRLSITNLSSSFLITNLQGRK